jgi:threonine aldolase
VDIDPATVATNIVIFRLADAGQARALVEAVEREGVLVWPFGTNRVRAVTHGGITADHCRQALGAIARALGQVMARA